MLIVLILNIRNIILINLLDDYYKNFKDALVNNIDIELDNNGNIIMESSSKTDFAFYDLLRGFSENLFRVYERVDRLGFHSDRKKMSTIVKRDDGKHYIYMKGAPEVILNSCKDYLKPTGDSVAQITNVELKKFDEITKKFSSLTLRNLAIAMKEVSFDEIKAYKESKANTSHLNYEIEKENFTLIGIAAINDALRAGVPQSVALCHAAFVRVIMITGDDVRIAEAIARNAGIINNKENYLSLTGNEFFTRIGGIACKTCTMDIKKCNCPKTIGQARLRYGDDKDDEFLESKIRREKVHNMEQFQKIIPTLRVIARARAIDKYALV